jgi:hypothetical protein
MCGDAFIDGADVVVNLRQTAKVFIGDRGLTGTTHDRRLELPRAWAEHTLLGKGDT